MTMRDWMPDVTEEEMSTLEAATGDVDPGALEVHLSITLIDALIERRGPLFEVPPRPLWRSRDERRKAPPPVPDEDDEPAAAQRFELVRRVYVDLLAARSGWLPGTPWGVA